MRNLILLSLFVLGSLLSCALGDEMSATINFWDYKNAVVKDWKENKDSFHQIDFSDSNLVKKLIEIYGTSSEFATIEEKKVTPARLLIGSPENDYFGCQYFYKFYTEEAPLKSVLGTWTGSVLYAVYQSGHPVIEKFVPSLEVDTVYGLFLADAQLKTSTSPKGRILIRTDIGMSTKIILDGYSLYYPFVKEEGDVQRVHGANLEGMYMTGFDIAFSNEVPEKEDSQKGETE